MGQGTCPSTISRTETQAGDYAVDVPAVELLATIPGVGPKISATLAGEIGDIDRFSNAKQLVAFLGIDPSVRQSGKFVGTKNRLTKRGSPFAHRSLYLAAAVSVRGSKKGP
ncbi:MAG: IS110 family transposase [Peptococcaceae bacterium]|nr:IS110 family transposase [Candidatus Syntrophopropionicum ammoniitolerans]